MKTPLLVVLCAAALFVAGCKSGITRTGYQLPASPGSTNLVRCPIAIQCDRHYNADTVEVLGSVKAYDTGFSVDCDEAYVLDIFCKEACALGADLVVITEEKHPNPWTSTCYRAKADFVRFRDRSRVVNLLSDPQYAPQLIIDRSVAASKRNREVITGAVLGGLLGAIVVSAATAH